jgi:predicted esterase
VPGTEIRLDVPESGSYFLLYIPTDYVASRPFPLIVCYHGYGGTATTWPFRQATGGAGFLIAGMEYGSDAYHRRLVRDDPSLLDGEIAHFRASLKRIVSLVNVDPKRIVMGGFSQGGYSTTLLGEALLNELAGMVVLGAGRFWRDAHPPSRRGIWRKPVFIGVGEQDENHYRFAKEAAELYRRWGANVTFEEWAGVGHTFPGESPRLLDWLRRVGTRETRALVLSP